MSWQFDDSSLFDDEPEPPRYPERQIGSSVQDLINALMQIEDKSASLTIKVIGNERDIFTRVVTVQDSPNYTTGPRVFLRIT